MDTSIVLELPADEEIAVMEEVRSLEDPGVIRKTIRYRNGIIVILFQDFQNIVFRIEINSERLPFFLTGNQILRVD